jgi:hypothetical protein
VLQETSLEPVAGSRLPRVVDERGSEVDRRTLVQAERILLCEVTPGFLLLWTLLGCLSKRMFNLGSPGSVLKARAALAYVSGFDCQMAMGPVLGDVLPSRVCCATLSEGLSARLRIC